MQSSCSDLYCWSTEECLYLLGIHVEAFWVIGNQVGDLFSNGEGRMVTSTGLSFGGNFEILSQNRSLKSKLFQK